MENKHGQPGDSQLNMQKGTDYGKEQQGTRQQDAYSDAGVDQSSASGEQHISHEKKEESNSYVSYNGNSDDTPPVEPS